MTYPKDMFSIREDVTRKNMEEYDKKKKIWYDAAEKLYPNYFQMGLRERLEHREEINNYVGFKL